MDFIKNAIAMFFLVAMFILGIVLLLTWFGQSSASACTSAHSKTDYSHCTNY